MHEKQLEQLFIRIIKQDDTDFKFHYDWSNYKEIKKYLMRLMIETKEKNRAIIDFIKQALISPSTTERQKKNLRKQLQDSKSLQTQLSSIMHDVEEFFASGIKTGLFHKDNLPRILGSLNQNLHYISILSPEYGGVYGYSVGDRMEINQHWNTHPKSPLLTAEEIRRLYIFHEMGHKILNISKNKERITNFTSTIEQVLQRKGVVARDLVGREWVLEGFQMIEECLTQEMAEYLTYHSVQKRRPNYEFRMDLGCKIQTNLDYYGIFQEPTTEFGRTLKSCSRVNSNRDEILINMIKMALNSDFVKNVITEYSQGDGQLYYDLFLILRAMGLIKKEKYASFNVEQGMPVNVQSCLDAISSITSNIWYSRVCPPINPKEIDLNKKKIKDNN